MKVKKYQLILCLWVIIAGGIVFVFFREKLEKNPNALKFEEHQFNDSIKENMEIGYYFKIENKTYYQNTDTMFVFYPKNEKEVRALIENYRNAEELIDEQILWRDVLPPFRLIKEEKGDTLVIIKKGRDIFLQEKK